MHRTFAWLLVGWLGTLAWFAGCGSNPRATARSGAEAGAGALEDAGPELDDVANAEDAAADWLVPPNLARDAGDDALASLRQACTFGAGAWPAQTLGNEYPIGADIPINHVIVIVQENRSFDHYLGRLVAQGYYEAGDFTAGADGGEAGSGFSSSTQLDGPPPGWSNPDGDGGIVVPHPDDEYCYDVQHDWVTMHNDWDNGKNDGFVIQNNPGGAKTFFYEDDTVIPFYYALANAFSVGDRYFCAALTQTWPNRYFLMAATSFGIADDADYVQGPVSQIFSLLEAGGHTWKDYADEIHMEEFFGEYGLSPDFTSRYGTIGVGQCTLFNDIEKGTLPDVSFVMGSEVFGEDSDEGPAALPEIGGQLVETIIRSLWASSSWKDTAVFITYDENGGIADHVPPAPACEPDSYVPHDVDGGLLAGKFNTTGFRVPFIVVSPYAKAHFASHVVHDHTSILRFIEARFGLPALTARDANANPPMEMFDFANPPFMTPPTITATTVIPPAVLATPQCANQNTLAPLCGR